jgi:hypothetical protein
MTYSSPKRAFVVDQGSIINPYWNFLRSFREITRKIVWDSTNNAATSRRNLTRLCNYFFGEKAVILCNGPSLLSSDLTLLQDVYTIGLNKINLLFERYDFRPSSIVAVNPYVIEQNKAFYSETRIPLFLDRKAALSSGLHATDTRTLLFSSSGYPRFSCDPRYAIDQGSTVTYVAMQLAYFMGFKSVALIGCDHSFITQGTDHQIVTSGAHDPNHFDPRYFSGGLLWQLPSISESEESYLRAKGFYERDQRVIYNCTVGGKLEIYPRISLGEFLAL